MYSIREIKKANMIYKRKVNNINFILNALNENIKKVNDSIDLEEVKKTLSYAETKNLYELIINRSNNAEVCNNLKSIMEQKKIEEYPESNDVHYYPIINLINFLNKKEKIALDNTLKLIYQKSKSIKEINKMDPKIIDFLIVNSIIEKLYIFRCNCGSDECYNKEITQEYFDKLKNYWEKEKEGKTTHGEDQEMHYGCFETGCWYDGNVEISSLEEFNQHLKSVKYKVVKKPVLTLDLI